MKWLRKYFKKEIQQIETKNQSLQEETFIPIEVLTKNKASLTEIDFYSSTWIALEDRLTKRLAYLREKNDGVGLTETKTSVLRGQIKEIKLMLNLQQTLLDELEQKKLAQGHSPQTDHWS